MCFLGSILKVGLEQQHDTLKVVFLYVGTWVNIADAILMSSSNIMFHEIVTVLHKFLKCFMFVGYMY